MRELTELRAGAAGKLHLARTRADVASSALLAPARHWESATLYRVVRHRRLAAAALAADIAEECHRLRLPRVDVDVLEARGIAGLGLAGRTRLRFATAVAGPILTGRDRHFGGGLFAACPSQRHWQAGPMLALASASVSSWAFPRAICPLLPSQRERHRNTAAVHIDAPL
jgi:CRISPR-associated protein Csb2